MNVSFACASDVGRQRILNEDSYLIIDNKKIAALFDGLGGQAAGDVASSMAMETFKHLFSSPNSWDHNDILKELDPSVPSIVSKMIQAIRLTNRRIYNASINYPEKRGMATTVVALGLEDNSASITHVGDSRAYRIRGDDMLQLTRDHSWINDLSEDADILPDQATVIQDRNVRTRALGVNISVKVDVRVEKIEPGDIFLHGSDGLTEVVQDSTILESVLKYRTNPTESVQHLVQIANDAGGPDNITVIVVNILALNSQREKNITKLMKTIPEENEMERLNINKIIKKLFKNEDAWFTEPKQSIIKPLLNKFRL